MIVTITPSAGERLVDQINFANRALMEDHRYNLEFVIQMNDGLKTMRTYHTWQEIRDYIWDGYTEEDFYA